MTDSVSQAATYGNAYSNKSEDKALQNALQTRTSRRRTYGFNIPESVANEVSEEELSLAILSQGFCNNTTSHGVAHIYNATSAGKKAVWAIFSLLAVGALAYHLSQLVSTYIEFDTSTDIKVNTSIRQIEFPAVTICNNNKIKSSTINDHLRDLVDTASNKTDRLDAKREIAETLAYEYSLLEDSDFKWSLGHQLFNMALFTEFAYSDVYDNFEHLFNPAHGNCYTFNHYSQVNRTTAARAGAANGLWMMMNIEQYEYVPFLTEASGIKVLVHDANEMPFPEDGGITVAPNTLTNLAIRKTEFTRLNGRYGDCYGEEESKPSTIYFYEHGYNYSKAACQKSCLQAEIIKSCGCFMPQIPYSPIFFGKNVTPCEQYSVGADCMLDVDYAFTIGSVRCEECKDPCKQQIYDVTPSTTSWPAPTYMNDLKSEIQEIFPEVFAALKSHYAGSELNVPIQENLLQLQIFYDRMSVTQITETPEMSDFQFISDLGGSLGLWVGWSMLTIFEFFEYGIDLIVLALIKSRATNLRKVDPHSKHIRVEETVRQS